MHALRNLGWLAYLLCLAAGSLYMANGSRTSAGQYRSGYAFERDFDAGPAIAGEVVMVVLNGLRTDAAAGLPAFGQLAKVGASGSMRVTVPSLANPARAAFATGAWPEVSGVTNNANFESVPVQSLFGLASRRGLRSSVFGPSFWPQAFGESVERGIPAGRYSSYAVSELVRWQSQYCDDALEHLAGSDAAIRVVDLEAGDQAGHTYGGASDAYREVMASVDACLGRIAGQVGAQVTLLALSNHGHIHRRGSGGHGGLEPEVLHAPFALAGPGVRHASQIEAEIVDIAPTISTLLGLPIPANSQGRVLWEALDVPAEHEADLRRLEQEQRTALQAHMPDRAASLEAQKSGRLPAAILVGFCLVAAIFGSVYGQRQHATALCVSSVCFVLAYFSLFYAFGLGYSISMIARQEYLHAFLAKDVASAVVAFGVATAVLFRLVGRRSETAIRLAALIGSAAALLVTWIYFDHGLWMDRWMVAINPVFQAYLHMLAIVGVVVAVFVVVVLNRLLPGSREPARRAMTGMWAQPDSETEGGPAADFDRVVLPPLLAGRRFRNLAARLKDTLGLFLELQRDFGPIVRYKILTFEFCLLSDPKLVEEVLYDKRSSFEKGFIYKRSLLFTRPTVITADGKDHRRVRRLVQPYLRRETLGTYSSIMAENAVAMRERWRHGETLDIDKEVRDATLASSLEIFFGRSMRIDSKLTRRVFKLFTVDAALAMIPYRRLCRLILSAFRGLQRSYAEMGSEVFQLVESARADTEDRRDLVAHLARSTDESGKFALDEKQVFDNVVESLMASFITTASVLGWTIYYVSRTPAVRERLEHEIDTTLDGRSPTLEDFDSLQYTRAVIAEALRLAPSAYYLGRQATKDCTIGGYLIPAGSNVQLFSLALQKDERYFPQAEQFRPERWLGEQPLRPKCSYMPFGAGTRDCAGQMFAQVNMTFVLASITQRWQLDLLSEEFPKLNTLTGYFFKHGLPVRASAR